MFRMGGSLLEWNQYGGPCRHALAHSMLLPTPEMKPSGLSDVCASDPPIWMGGGFALAFLPSDISATVYTVHALFPDDQESV